MLKPKRSYFILPLLALVAASPSFVAAQEGDEQGLIREPVRLQAEDGGRSMGIYYAPADRKPKTAILAIHPIGNNMFDWKVMALAKAGYGGLGMASRYINNEVRQIHEEVLLDIAAGVRFLKQEKGIEKVILLGHSGGGSILGFYQEQAETAPPNRISSTPAGDPPNLNEFELPLADGLIVSAAHRGRAWSLMAGIDPSVADENDPLSVIPSLDMYSPANGLADPMVETRYSEKFKTTYREAQKARIRRLDEKARALVEEQNRNRKLMKSPEFARMSREEQIEIERRATATRLMVIYRTDARLRYTDLHEDPSDRIVTRPDLWNYREFSKARAMTPRAFLSSRSFLSTNVDLHRSLSKTTVPLLVIYGTSDLVAFPGQQRGHFDAATVKDKQIIAIVGGDHGYLPLGPKAGEGKQREEAAKVMADWLAQRFPK